MPTYALMGDTISNAAGNGPPSFPFGVTLPSTMVVKDIANAPYTITNSDGVGFVTSTVTLTGAALVNLPSAASNIGRRIQFKKIDSGAFPISVVVSGGDTIDGLTTSFNINNPYGSISVMAITAGRWAIVDVSRIAPTMTRIFTTGSTQVYNVPSGCIYLSIEMVGAGGGGGGGATGGSATNNATAGGDTIWKVRLGAAIVTCGGGGAGGAGGVNYSNLGGVVTTGAPAISVMNITGMRGGTACNVPSGSYSAGAQPGITYWGGGAGAMGNTPAMVPSANTGNGGGGGGTGNAGGNQGGGGGSAGAFSKFLIYNPAAQYDVVIGVGGTGGTPTAGAQAGANGADGGAIITEFFA